MPSQTVCAAWYGRVSSLGQVEDGSSLQTQQDKCENAIAARGWQPAGQYVDAGISGAKNDRPEWQRLLADCRAGKVQAVVVASLDRMARNASHAIAVTDELQQLGVAVVVLRENIDLATPAGRMMRTMLAGVAEMERDLIRERSIAGQRAKSLRSQWPGGRPSYGWRLEGKGKDSRPVPHEAERRTLEQMRGWLVNDGASCGLIARDLNQLGIPTRTGAQWTHPVVRRILANPTLVTGTYNWGFVGLDEHGRYHRTASKQGQPTHGEPVVITMPEPPLTQVQFDEVQQALARHPLASRTRPEQSPQMLTGRIFGPCGHHYIGVKVKQGFVYRCQGRRRLKPGQSKCDCKQFDAPKFDTRVWSEVVAVLGDRERLLLLAKQWLEVGTASDPGAVEREAEKLTAKVTRLERAITRAKEAWLFSDDPDEGRATLARLREDLAQTRAKLVAAQVVSPQARENADRLTDLAALADRAATRLQEMGPGQRRELVGLLQLDVRVTGPVVASEPESYSVKGMLRPENYGPSHSV